MKRVRNLVVTRGPESRLLLLALAAIPVSLVLFVMGAFGSTGEHAQAAHGVVNELFARGKFTDNVKGILLYNFEGTESTRIVHINDASDMIAVKVTIPPGDESPWHSHPGPGLIAVAQGTLTITYASDCIPRPYAAGEAFMEPGGVVMRADNFGEEDAVVYVTFLGVPPGPPTEPYVGEAPC
jgi:quercetin dioxygenase-like cupin family protein